MAEPRPPGARTIAIDGAGNAWTGSYQKLAKFSNAGVPISASTGYVNSTFGSHMQIAIDGSGNVWIVNGNSANFAQMIGAATPVVTPFATGIASGTLATRP